MKCHLKNIKLFGYHGLYENEKNDGQHFILNIFYEVTYYTKSEDQFKKVIDYSDILSFIKKVFNAKRYSYMEVLVSEIARITKSEYSLDQIKVKITKIAPTGCDEVENISVTYEL